MATETGGEMVMTVLEAEVSREGWADLTHAFAAASGGDLPVQLVSTSLAQDAAEPARWRIVTLWRSRSDLDAYRKATAIPGGVLMFRAAGAEPALSVFTVVDHYAHQP